MKFQARSHQCSQQLHLLANLMPFWVALLFLVAAKPLLAQVGAVGVESERLLTPASVPSQSAMPQGVGESVGFGIAGWPSASSEALSSFEDQRCSFFRMEDILAMREAPSLGPPSLRKLTSTKQAEFVETGPVSVISGEGIIREPSNYFDLKAKTLRFTPRSDGGYALDVLPLNFDPDVGPRLRVEDSIGLWHSYGWPVTIPFDFPFAGRRWDQLFVNLHGNISFSKSESSSWSERDPWSDAGMRSVAAAIDARAAAGAEEMIAALWANYSFSSEDSKIYAKSTPESFVVTWEVTRQPNFGTSDLSEFQASLFPSGAIELSYRKVSEQDGIVGVFQESPPSTLSLDHVETPRVPPEPTVDIASIDVYDAGTALRFSISMNQDIPSSVNIGTVEFRIFLEMSGRTCGFGLGVSDTRRAFSWCSPAPRVVGFQVDGKVIHLFVSKLLLVGAEQFQWSADAVWWGRQPGQFEGVGPMRMVDLQGSFNGQTDLSSQVGPAVGNTFEVFHHPLFPRDVADVLPVIYKKFPPNDDFAVVFRGFRMDDLFSTGGSTGALNVPVKGIGEGLVNPRPGSDIVGSARLQVSMAPVYVGATIFDETVMIGNRAIHGYPMVVGWVTHETGHRWGLELRFRNSLTGQENRLTDDWCRCHWNDGLHTPAVTSISGHYTSSPYPEDSPMGGLVWNANPDGTFSPVAAPFGTPTGFSALDLYIMGLLPPEEVAETFILQNVRDLGGNRFRGTQVPVRIEDVIAVMGSREPSATESPKEFTLGVYLVEEPGDAASRDKASQAQQANLLRRAEEVSGAIAKHFELATAGRMRINHSRLVEPQINANGILNAASFESRSLSPGEIVSLFGSVLGPPLPGAAGNVEDGERWSTEAAGVRVYFDGTPGAVVFVREDQLNAVVPYDVEGKDQVKVEVEHEGLRSNAVTMSVISVAPGIFTSDGSGGGQAAALNEDGSFNTSLRPAGQQTIVVFYVTGEGQTSPAGEDGKLALDVFPKPIQPVRVFVDGREAAVLYAGAAPTFVAGLMQVNARLPEGTGSGNVSLVVEVGGVASQDGVTIAVR